MLPLGILYLPGSVNMCRKYALLYVYVWNWWITFSSLPSVIKYVPYNIAQKTNKKNIYTVTVTGTFNHHPYANTHNSLYYILYLFKKTTKKKQEFSRAKYILWSKSTKDKNFYLYICMFNIPKTNFVYIII